MSGIAGIINFDGAPVEPGLIVEMTSSMAHRGPDGIQHWVKGNVALGQCMLRTTPESMEETQPLTNEDESLVLVMDGRVDNWEELRRELLGHGAMLRTRSDAELVLRAYEAWGKECLKSIDGDFALVIWDARNRTAFCARDRMGIKPFYYWQNNGHLIFASDFHAILSLPGSPREVNEAMIAEHLAIVVNNLTDTLITGVNRLPPAHFLVSGNALSSIEKYWDIDCLAQINYPNEADYAEHFMHLFRQAVRQQSRSLGAVGVYLSGGIDSSSVACVTAGLAPEPAKIHSFSLIFPDKECDESRYIELANRHCHLLGFQIPGVPPPLSHYLEQTRHFLDLCDGPNGAMLDPLRTQAQAQGIRVLLTGYGGDEWFGRSGYYYAHLLKHVKLARLAGQLAFDYSENHSMSKVLNSLIYRGVSPLIPDAIRDPLRRLKKYIKRKNEFENRSINGVIHPELAYRVSLAERVRQPNRCQPGADPAHRYTHALLPLGWNVRGLEIENRGLAMFGLEERSPYYERKIVEFAFGLPEDLRSWNAGKYLIRQSMRGTLPESIRVRHDKAEFSEVLADTLVRGEARDWILGGRMAARGWTDADQIRRMYKDFVNAYADGSGTYIDLIWKLWMVLALETWIAAIDG